jgi:hypothetical protein
MLVSRTLPVEACHPCPSRAISVTDSSLLELLMCETGRRLLPASKARPKRSSDNGTRRFIAAAGTAWMSGKIGVSPVSLSVMACPDDQLKERALLLQLQRGQCDRFSARRLL